MTERAELLYPGEAGCAALTRAWQSGPPSSCGAEPVGTVEHPWRYPRPRVGKLMVCAEHARGYEVRALDDADRAELARRRARERRPRT